MLLNNKVTLKSINHINKEIFQKLRKNEIK